MCGFKGTVILMITEIFFLEGFLAPFVWTFKEFKFTAFYVGIIVCVGQNLFATKFSVFTLEFDFQNKRPESLISERTTFFENNPTGWTFSLFHGINAVFAIHCGAFFTRI